jgi:heme exporter protein D
MTFELFGFTITAFLFWKLVGLAVLAGIVNFVYTLKTGRYLTDDRNQLAARERSGQVPAKPDRESR